MTVYNPVSTKIVEELKEILGEKYVWTDEDRMEPYSHDELTGDKYIKYPEAVVFPETAEQISQIVQLANRELIPIVPRGAGTGYTAGSVAYEGGIVVTTERMNHILEMDEQNLIMVAEPGISTSDIQKAAQERGYMYAGDPSSGDSSFIGGNVATNAGGNKAVKYGTTRQQVYGLEIVTPKGDIVTLGGKLKKDSTGYCLTQLIVGSEGTLGIVTKIYLKIVPLPKEMMNLLAVFPTRETAINTVPKIIKANVAPVCVEFMDNKAIRASEDFLREKLPHSESGHYVIISLEGNNEEVLEDQCVIVDEICEANGAVEVLVADAAKIWKARKSFGEASRHRSLIFSSEDIVVPLSEIAKVIEKLGEIGEKYGITINCVAHAADGNIHADILKEDMPVEKWDEVLPLIQEDIYAFVYKLGGKLSGEHGIGYKRLKLMKKLVNPAELEMMRAIKKALDPNNIMNPGKIFSLDD